ncbi:MAG TPA: hypothetical protein PLE93_02850, partial [Solirubrobacterales bacterium]|nr:hypothetical protein [Solirubrobacterales bacterium]
FNVSRATIRSAIGVLAERLEQQIGECLEQGELPRGAERERLIAVADALCRATPSSDDSLRKTATVKLNLTARARKLFKDSKKGKRRIKGLKSLKATVLINGKSAGKITVKRTGKVN